MIEPSPQVPLSIEPIVGWRVWRLREVSGRLSLLSLTRSEWWPAGVPIRARCPTHVGAGTPNVACSCGIYAADSPAHLARAGVFTLDACVVGAIAMWGTVVEHATGARSELAYPARLRLVCAACLHEGRGGVQPAFVFGSGFGSGVVALCRRHSLGQQSPSRPAQQVEQELLSTYGVEIVPLERVGRRLRVGRVGRAIGPGPTLLGFARVLFATIGFLIQASMALMLATWVVFGVLAIVGGVVRTFGPHDATPAISPAPEPAIGSSVGPSRSGNLPPHGAPGDPVPPVAFVCGAPGDGSIRIVRCGGGREMLLGIAHGERPQGARGDCAGMWDVYSRGRHYSICWIALPGHRDIGRHMASEDPFERTDRTVN